MTASLKEIQAGFKALTNVNSPFNATMRAERCKMYGYYAGMGGMTHLEWRLYWHVPASLYYKDTA